MKRPTRSKFSGAELRDSAKAGNLPALKEVWATYLEGDVSEKYKEALGLLSIAINQNDSSLFNWLASELEALERKWSSLPNALKEGKTTPARLRALDGAIHAACRQQQVPFVKRLLELGFDPNHPDKESDLPIHIACKNGNLEVLQLLLSVPTIQVDKPDIDGDTPMTLAIRHKHPELLEALHERGADVNKPGKNGYTPLMVAIMQLDSEAITTLLRMAADIHLMTTRGVTTLGVASGVNNLAMMQLMLGETETNVNAVDENNATALMAACTFGHIEAAELLLDNGAYINAQTKVGSTAFWHACEFGHYDVVLMLAKRGADINCPNKAGVTPLMAAAMGGHLNVVQLLIGYGVDINAIELVHHKTVLHEASGRGCVEVVAALLQAGATVDCCDLQWQSTPLQYAAKQGHADVATLLLQHGADVNKPNADGMTPIISAAEHNRIEALEVLLKWEGVHVDHMDKDGDTALLRACLHGYPATVELLLAHGVNTNLANKKGKTALLLVREESVKKRPNYHRCEQILMEHLSGKAPNAGRKKGAKQATKQADGKQKSSEREPKEPPRKISCLPPLSHSREQQPPPQSAPLTAQQQQQQQQHLKHQATLKQQAQQAQIKQRQHEQEQLANRVGPQGHGDAGRVPLSIHSHLGQTEQLYKMEPASCIGPPRNGKAPTDSKQGLPNPSTATATAPANNTGTGGAGAGVACNGVQGPASTAAQTAQNSQPTVVAHCVKSEVELVEEAARAAQKLAEQYGHVQSGEGVGGDGVQVQGGGVASAAGEIEGQQGGGVDGAQGGGVSTEGRTQGVKRGASADAEGPQGDSKRRKFDELLEVSKAMNTRTEQLNAIIAEQGRVDAQLARLQAAQKQLQQRRSTTQAEVDHLKSNYDELYAQVGL